MAVSISHGKALNLQATVSGDFDFETSRQLLLGVKKEWRGGARGVDIVLREVTRATSCSIGTLMLISELAGRNFQLRTERCRSEVQGLFDSGLLDRFFPAEVLAGCRSCLARAESSCTAA